MFGFVQRVHKFNLLLRGGCKTLTPKSESNSMERSEEELFNRFAKEGQFKILVGVATEFSNKNIHAVNGLDTVYGSEFVIYNAHSKPVAENYTEIVNYAILEDFDFLITVEDDTYPPKDAFTKLVKLALEHKDTVIGGWYAKKDASKQSVHLEIKDGIRRPIEPDGKLHKAYSIAMGCTIFPVSMFKKIEKPWFKTGKDFTQDVYFSQVAREAGFKLLVDTSIMCKHLDIKNAIIY